MRAKIEEEIFHPFLAATKDKDVRHEAIIEHDGSNLRVLSEMIKYHVKEEDQTDGMFAEAKQSKKTDLRVLGAQLFERKQTLMAELDA